MTAPTQTLVDACTIARAINEEHPLARPVVTDDHSVVITTATGGTVTVEPDYGSWVVSVRDASGCPTPFAGIQSTYVYEELGTAVRAAVLALLADAERAPAH